MTAARHDYEELHHLVDRMTPAQVRRALVLVNSDPELAPVAADAEAADDRAPDDRLSWIGSIDSGESDMSENHDVYIRKILRDRQRRSGAGE